jgi:hypothetical protein
MKTTLRKYELGNQPVQSDSGWQDISTAPLNKTYVALLNVSGKVCRYGVGYYMPMDGWKGWPHVLCGEYKLPTHWSPLPPAPSLSAD